MTKKEALQPTSDKGAADDFELKRLFSHKKKSYEPEDSDKENDMATVNQIFKHKMPEKSTKLEIGVVNYPSDKLLQDQSEQPGRSSIKNLIIDCFENKSEGSQTQRASLLS